MANESKNEPQVEPFDSEHTHFEEALEDVVDEVVDDTALLSNALGGWRGMVDSGLPSITFLLAYLGSSHNLKLSIEVALVTGVVLTVERIARKKSLQQVLSGGLGLAVSAYITSRSGQAQNFFLPGILTNLGYFVVCLASMLFKRPVLGYVISGLKGQTTSWVKDPAMYRLYSTVTLLWVFVFGLRVGIMLPLYLAGAVAALGVVKLVLGWPLYLLGIYATVRVLKGSSSVGEENLKQGSFLIRGRNK